MLAGLGFRDFRVRMYHGGARLQVTEEQLALALEKRLEIVSGLRELFPAVMLDMEPRS